jgi:hypothetical protein
MQQGPRLVLRLLEQPCLYPGKQSSTGLSASNPVAHFHSKMQGHAGDMQRMTRLAQQLLNKAASIAARAAGGKSHKSMLEALNATWRELG